MCVWLLFLSLSSDVSTFQEDDYCRDHSNVDERTDSKKHEDRLLTEYRLISTNKKIDYWLDVEDSSKKIDTVDLLIKFSFFITMSWLASEQKNRLLSRFVDMKMLYVNSSFNSRKFVLWLRDFSQENFRFVKILLVTSLMKTSCFMISQQEDDRLSLKKNFDLTILFFLLAYFDEQSTQIERLIECQLISQNSEREICCARDSESPSLRLIKRIALKTSSSQVEMCWRCESSQIERSCFFLLADR